ncbi:TonB-dependent receptor plug domain-containing protein [Oleidesulfovibrio sp.]|uniref:TonB-dependent receptor plug domain-containing protein n=1 Tax=Oleidesulfovibrio sp. TaxID=2909707 RepID=UPI003A8858DE
MKRVVLSCLMLLLTAAAAHAQEQAEAGAGGAQRPKAVLEKMEGSKKEAAANATKRTTGDASDKVHKLSVVEVEDARNESGASSIGGQTLRTLPSYSGSITEALKGMSNVQFSNDMLSSHTGGEIKPPRISIAGADPWENSYMIDGMSITNRLNPNGMQDDSAHTSTMLSGADQTIFYDVRLLENINVYTNNIPAKYSGFTGGVVDSRLRDPKMDEWHFEVEGRHTRSKWFSLRGVDENSDSAESQPRFNVNTLSTIAEGLVNDNVGVLLGASRKYSTIPLKRKDNDGNVTDDDQHRISDNFFAKLLLRPNDDMTLLEMALCGLSRVITVTTPVTCGPLYLIDTAGLFSISREI